MWTLGPYDDDDAKTHSFSEKKWIFLLFSKIKISQNTSVGR
jgi:hypothetical protein